MACALKHAEILAPGADGLAILMCHHARDLVEMREVVNRPRREKLREID